MNIAIIIKSGTISGAEKRGLKIINELDSRKAAPDKFFLFIPKKLFSKYSESDYKTLLPANTIIIDDYNLYQTVIFRLLPKTSWKERFRSFLLNKLIAKYSIDVAHVFLAIGIAKHLKVATIFEITSSEYVQKIAGLSKNAIAEIGHFNAVSDSTYNGTLPFVSKDRLLKAPIPFFNPIDYKKLAGESALHKKENIIVFAHRLIPRKNGYLFAEVARELVYKYPDWKIKIFGNGPDEDRMKILLSEEISSGRIQMSYTPNILEELAASKIFVSIIQPDNYPSQSVLEAMYMGNALLLSDEGFTRDRFYAENGYLCDPTFESVYTQLERLILLDAAELESMGRNSLNLLNTKFNRDVYIDYLLNLYKQVQAKH